jgi:hypothetical protein
MELHLRNTAILGGQLLTMQIVHSGDLLAVSKIRGRWEGFETLEKWVAGSFAGHSVFFLKDEMGNLWVGESGDENEKVYNMMKCFIIFFR